MAVDQRDVLSDADLRRLTNPTDHAGRTARDIQQARDRGEAVGDILCPECASPMEVRGGDGLTLHLYHARGNANRNCSGAEETAWHLFCKYAAKHFGWSLETTVRLPCGVRRADAYREGEFLEFVHSLSPTYVTKHRQLAENGISCRWIIDSAASFGSKNGSETFDFGESFLGPLRVNGLLKPKMAGLVDSIGHSNCFIYYRWAVWMCVGHDEWEILPQSHELQRWCTDDGGFNNEIIIGHQRRSEHGYRVVVRPAEFKTNWRTQVDYLFEEVLGARSALAAQSIRIAAEAVARSRRSLLPHDNHYPGDPVCRRGRSSRYLTVDQARAIADSHATPASSATAENGRGIRITTHVKGQKPQTTNYRPAFVKDAFWAAGFAHLEVVLVVQGSECVDTIKVHDSSRFSQFCRAVGVDPIEIRQNPRAASASRITVTQRTKAGYTEAIGYLPRQ
jgi:hypothetical protein